MNYKKKLKVLIAALRACSLLAFFGYVPLPIQAQTVLPKPFVDAVEIWGNASVSQSVLKGLMITRSSPWYDFLPGVSGRTFEPEILGQDLARLRTYYRDQGYFEAQIDSTVGQLSNGHIRVRVRIIEGPVARISHCIVIGAQNVENPFAELEGKPYVRADITEVAREELNRLRNEGYAFATGEIDTAIANQQVEVTFAVVPGPQCMVDSIYIDGNSKVSKNTLRRGLTFLPGTQFRQQDLVNSQRQLYRAGVFRSVALGVSDSLSTENRVGVLVRVSERSFRAIRLGGGYDTDEDFWGSAAFTHRNFGGGARQLRVSGRLSGQNREALMGLRQPYFLGSRNWLNISGFMRRERRASHEQDEVGGNVSIERNITSTTDFIMQLSSGVVDFSADSAFVEGKIGLLIDTRDDLFDPTSGMLAQFSLRERGLFLKADEEFLQATVEGRWFWPIPMRSVFALRVQGGVIVELGKPDGVPNVERFFAGGLNSMRGWRINALGPKDDAHEPLGGLSRAEASVEIRTRVMSFLGTALFLDVGNVDDEWGAFRPQQLKWSVGAGLRYLSPIGPIRVDMGYRLSQDETLDISDRGRIRYHISLGQAF